MKELCKNVIHLLYEIQVFFLLLLTYCLVVLFITQNISLKPPTIIVDLSIFSFNSIMYFVALLSGAYIIVILSVSNNFVSKSILYDINKTAPVLYWLGFAWYIFPTLLFQPFSIFEFKLSHIDSIQLDYVLKSIWPISAF